MPTPPNIRCLLSVQIPRTDISEAQWSTHCAVTVMQRKIFNIPYACADTYRMCIPNPKGTAHHHHLLDVIRHLRVHQKQEGNIRKSSRRDERHRVRRCQYFYGSGQHAKEVCTLLAFATTFKRRLAAELSHKSQSFTRDAHECWDDWEKSEANNMQRRSLLALQLLSKGIVL